MSQAQDILSHIQPAIRYTGIALPSKEEKKESLLLTLFKRILTVIKKVFRYFVVASTPKTFNLSKRQIHLINKSQNLRRKSAIYPNPLPAEDKIAAEPQQPLTASMKQFHQYDSALNGLIQFLEAFSDVLINDCVLNDRIKPNLPELKQSLIKFFSEIEGWAGVFQNIRESGSLLINGLKAIDDPAITLIAQQLLQYFVSLDRQMIDDNLTERLQELYMTGKITEEQYAQALQYREPFFSWLYHTNNWFLNTNQPANLHYFISDTFRFFEDLADQVQKGSLTDLFQSFSDFIQNELEEEVEKILKSNTQPIASILAHRLADLIEKLPFAESFDQMVHAIVGHTEGWIHAENARIEREQILSESQKISKIRASNSREIQQKREADKLLEVVKEDGGIENYLACEFIWAFSNQSSCNQKIRQLIHCQLGQAEMIEESEIYDELVDKLYPILIPNSQYTLPYGLEIEINGISELIHQFKLTDKLSNLKDRAVKEFDRLIDESSIQKKENFREYFCAVSEIMIFEFIQSKIKGYLAESIQRIFTRLSSKQYLDFLMAQYLFPSFIDLSLKGYVNSYIGRKSSALAESFHQMLIGGRHFDFEARKNRLLEKLYLEIQTDFIDFDFAGAKIDQEKFNLLIDPTILALFEFIKSDCQEIPIEKISHKIIANSINRFFNYGSVAVNHDYGILVMNLLFRIGSFGGRFKKKVIGWFQNPISESASQALNNLRKDHTKLVDSIVEISKTSLLDAGSIRETFFSEEPSEESIEQLNERVRCELPIQVRHLSSLIHDLFYRFLESSYVPFIQYTTPSTDTICGLIRDIVDKLFQQPTLNKSLVISLTNILQTAFETASEEIKINQSSELKKSRF